MAVARLESTFLRPILAKIAVKPANTAEPNANVIHIGILYHSRLMTIYLEMLHSSKRTMHRTLLLSAKFWDAQVREFDEQQTRWR